MLILIHWWCLTKSDIIVKDRTTAIGQMIDSYLRSASELDDHAVHLLFSANRWEVAYVLSPLYP